MDIDLETSLTEICQTISNVAKYFQDVWTWWYPFFAQQNIIVAHLEEEANTCIFKWPQAMNDIIGPSNVNVHASIVGMPTMTRINIHGKERELYLGT